MVSSENKELHETIAELKRDHSVGRDSDDEHLQGMAIKLVRLGRERDEMKTARDRVQVQSCISYIFRSLIHGHARESI